MTHPSVVILAAGKGTRMLSSLPKVLHTLAGKPLLGHVLETARMLSATRIIVVYGHGGEAVPRAFANTCATFVRQEPQQGTGHALMQALPHLPPQGTTIVLYGDVPLTRIETLTRVLSHPHALCLLTAVLQEPTGYGRIVRDAAGKVVRIAEEKDATADERRVREINTGILAAPNTALRDWLSQLTNHNAQGEYYLTDVVPLALAAGIAVETETVQQEWEVQGVNSREQLAELERRYQLAVARKLMADGVTSGRPRPARRARRAHLRAGHEHRCRMRVRGPRDPVRQRRHRCALRDQGLADRRGRRNCPVQPPRWGQRRPRLPRRPLRTAAARGDPRVACPRGQLRGSEEHIAWRRLEGQPSHATWATRRSAGT